MRATMGIRVEPPTSRTPLHVFPFQAGHAQQLPRGVGCAFQQVGRHLLELLAGDGDFGDCDPGS